MTLLVPTKQQLSTDPPQNKEEAVLMFEIGEECQRRALRYLVEVVEMSYGEIVKFAHEGNSNSRINKDKLKRLAAKMKADGEPLRTKVPQNFLNAPKRPVRKRTETVENFEPEIKPVQVVVEEPTPEPIPTPSALPASTPEPELSEALSVYEKALKTWNGELGEHHEKIIRREKPRNRKIQKALPGLVEIKNQLKQTMEASSKDMQKHGAGQLGMFVAVVEKQLALDGEPGIKESLTRVIQEAERIQKFASESLRLLQL
mgnify:CR=1 FL=1